MANKHYPAQFKADAVALYRSRPGATIAVIDADLGINRETCGAGSAPTISAAAVVAPAGPRRWPRRSRARWRRRTPNCVGESGNWRRNATA